MIEQAPKCDGCKEIYAARIPSEHPPCDTCRERPREENEDAINIFFLVRDQLIMGMGGPVAINQQSVYEAMRLYEIKNQRRCFEKVLALSRWWLNDLASKG
jgi:hypothetical protein